MHILFYFILFSCFINLFFNYYAIWYRVRVVAPPTEVKVRPFVYTIYVFNGT